MAPLLLIYFEVKRQTTIFPFIRIKRAEMEMEVIIYVTSRPFHLFSTSLQKVFKKNRVSWFGLAEAVVSSSSQNWGSLFQEQWWSNIHKTVLLTHGVAVSSGRKAPPSTQRTINCSKCIRFYSISINTCMEIQKWASLVHRSEEIRWINAPSP